MFVAIIILVLSIGMIIFLNIRQKKKIKTQIKSRNESLVNIFEKNKKDQQKTKISTCEACGAIIETVNGDGTCPYCGAKQTKK